jgi:GMP synthase (glutamine-hydrolysing)
MIVLVDLEHERLESDYPDMAVPSAAGRLKVKYRLEDLSGQPCLIMRYHHVTPERLRALDVKALIVSGNTTEFEHYPEATLAGLRAALREGARPTLAFCGGSHILAQTYGAAVGPIGQRAPGDSPASDNARLAPGMIQERGYMPVRVIQPHPLFEGLGEAPVFLESHYWETKAPPADFTLYASTEVCRVQMIGHQSQPVYATQFHPEYWDDAHPDGRRFLENFFRVAGLVK